VRVGEVLYKYGPDVFFIVDHQDPGAGWVMDHRVFH
jgi:hypothetical protein